MSQSQGDGDRGLKTEYPRSVRIVRWGRVEFSIRPEAPGCKPIIAWRNLSNGLDWMFDTMPRFGEQADAVLHRLWADLLDNPYPISEANH